MTDYLVDLAANPNFKIDADGSGLAGLRDGSISAIFSGSWDEMCIRDSQRATKILTEIAITNQQKRASAVILQMS